MSSNGLDFSMIQGAVEAQPSKRKPLVPTKAPTATTSKRRPAAIKVTSRPSAAHKAAAPVLPAPMSKEEIEAQQHAPALGLTADLVRKHCLSKLEAAFTKVFVAYFETLSASREGEGPGDNSANGLQPSVNRPSSSMQDASGRRYDRAMDVDFMEVAPPIRSTELIVLDEEETAGTAGIPVSTSRGTALMAPDSSFADMISSSIEILTSQQSIENLSAKPESQDAMENPDNRRDPKEVENGAMAYAREVEQALFDKLKMYSREKSVWIAGSAYK